MQEGTVIFYNNDRQFGFIKPGTGDAKIFFHYSKGSLGRSVRSVPVPTPQKGDRVLYNVGHTGQTRATIWEFSDIRERLNTLTPAQLELVQRVLGSHAPDWEIRNALEELEENQRTEGREYFAAYHRGPGPRGTFYQVLLWARYYLAERGVTDPPLPRWPDMPRYTVRIKAGGSWMVRGVHYTQIQADTFAQHLQAESRYDGVRVVDLWPDAPPLSVGEAAKVLAGCGRDVLKDHAVGDSEASWLDPSWGQNTEVARAYFGTGGHSWVSLNGHTYEGDEAEQLKFCGSALRVAHN